MLSKVMLNWLAKQEEDDVDGYLDVDLFIKEWVVKVEVLEDMLLEIYEEESINNAHATLLSDMEARWEAQ